MNFFAIGINHKTAPIEIREQFYLNEIEQELLLSELKCEPTVIEAFVVSTCNRTEVYVNVINTPICMNRVIKLIMQIKKLPFDEVPRQYFYILNQNEALKHLFHVSTGLDSLVIGEKQILGQVKKSFERSQLKGMFSKNFNILSNSVIRAGKKAHTETKISYGGSSVSWAAITKAEKHLGNLSEKSVLVIGAGKMSELAVGQLVNRGFKNLYLMNRTEENAKKVARKFDGEVVPFCDLKETLAKVDLCICSIGAPHYIIHEETVAKAMHLRGDRCLMLIDISMPRNIDPKSTNVENVKLYSIDDLDTVVEKNMAVRKQAIVDVNSIIDSKLSDYFRKVKKLDNLQEAEFSQAI